VRWRNSRDQSHHSNEFNIRRGIRYVLDIAAVHLTVEVTLSAGGAGIHGFDLRSVEGGAGSRKDSGYRRESRGSARRSQHDWSWLPDRKAIRKAKTDTELKKELSQLSAACRTVVDVLDADLNGSCQIEAMLADPWRGSQVPRLVEELRSLLPGLETALAMARQSGATKKSQQDPETVFFLAAHDLFSKITGDQEPGIAGPLHRFTRHCAALVDAGIAVSESDNSFRKRLTAALARRNGKISVVPEVIFPEK
jgi:hypothetical protein